MKNMNDDFRALLLEDMQDISAKVSDAICPISAASMPLSVIILENYVQVLKSRPEFDNEFYMALKSSLHCIAFIGDAENSGAAAVIKDAMRKANMNRRDR